MAEIPDSIDKDKVIRSLNLLRIIVGEKVELDDNGFGLCPFHGEKTASFHVFQAKSGRARYFCFGCGASGDIFNFLRLTENLGFNAAVSRLSERLGREIAPVISSSRAPEPQRDPDIFCEKDCLKYINLRDDYEILLEENHRLREQLGLPDFQPSNEESR